jgi:hypothetical protein
MGGELTKEVASCGDLARSASIGGLKVVSRHAMLPKAMTLQEEDRGRLVDMPCYGERIERNLSGAACHHRQFGLAQLSRGDGSSLAIGGRFDVIGHVYLLLFNGGAIVYA